MKIGIITFHRAINYGALLQTYALNKVLNDMGVDAEVIDYRAEYIENIYYKGKNGGSLLKKIDFLRVRIKTLKKYIKFYKFSKENIQASKPVNKETIAENEGKYDMYISGSDQVWNPDCTEFDKTYFLDFTTKGKKASYAASIGTKTMNERYEAEALKLISDFSHISIREKQGMEYLKEKGISAQIVLDPTLLLNKAKWLEASKKSKYEKDKYVLLYMLVYSESLVSFAKKLATEKGCKVIKVGRGKDKGIIYAPNLGPDEFLSLFNNAEYVVTNSFHGTAFSINFNKKFYVEYQNVKNSRNSRMEDILNNFGLKNRIINESDKKYCDEEIDYVSVNKKLDEERKKSIDYLKNIIN